VGQGAERAAKTEARFREANEQIRAKAVELGFSGQRSPYLCECGDRGCTAVLLLTAEEYEDVRSSSRRFVVAAGHEAPTDYVLGEHGAFTVVEKTDDDASEV
jgi:hypothetical protein